MTTRNLREPLADYLIRLRCNDDYYLKVEEYLETNLVPKLLKDKSSEPSRIFIPYDDVLNKSYFTQYRYNIEHWASKNNFKIKMCEIGNMEGFELYNSLKTYGEMCSKISKEKYYMRDPSGKKVYLDE